MTANMSAGMRKKWADPEYRASISRAAKAMWADPEYRARQSLAGRASRGDRNRRWRGGVAEYHAIHIRARKELVNDPCAFADDTCAGRLEAAFRHDAPGGSIRVSPKGAPYYIGDVRDGYWRLCRSHHIRYDAAHRES